MKNDFFRSDRTDYSYYYNINIELLRAEVKTLGKSVKTSNLAFTLFIFPIAFFNIYLDNYIGSTLFIFSFIGLVLLYLYAKNYIEFSLINKILCEREMKLKEQGDPSDQSE